MSKQQKNAPQHDSSPSPESVPAEPIEDLNALQKFLHWRQEQKRKREELRRKRGWLLDWVYTIVEVVLIVTFIRVVVAEAFRIPSGSMENTLLVGDFLLANKFKYGVRTPDWVGIPYTNIGFETPYFRVPSIWNPEPGDVIIFRYPVNQRLNYIKRCVATEGQVVEVKNKTLYIDGEESPLPPKGKWGPPRSTPPPNELLEGWEIGRASGSFHYGPVTVPEATFVLMDTGIAEAVAVGGQTLEIEGSRLIVDGQVIPTPEYAEIFSFAFPDMHNGDPETVARMMQFLQTCPFPMYRGSRYNYGPIRVPEGHLFMMGDNRDNSADSRYWGFLPKKLVLGEAMILYFSFNNKAAKIWQIVRWNRLLHIIH